MGLTPLQISTSEIGWGEVWLVGRAVHAKRDSLPWLYPKVVEWVSWEGEWNLEHKRMCSSPDARVIVLSPESGATPAETEDNTVYSRCLGIVKLPCSNFPSTRMGSEVLFLALFGSSGEGRKSISAKAVRLHQPLAMKWWSPTRNGGGQSNTAQRFSHAQFL